MPSRWARRIAAELSRPPCSREAFSAWAREPLGRAVLAEEQRQIGEILSGLYGTHLMQFGGVGEVDLLAGSRISHRVVMERGDGERSGLHGALDALPIASDAIAVALLPHTLEFAVNPHEVLRETHRVLIPEGHAVIVGFNPWSLWGGWRWLRRRRAPWCGRFLGAPRLRDWLTLLGFEVRAVRFLYHRPPVAGMVGVRSMERLGARWWPVLGAAYIMVARKRVVPLTPVRPRWRSRRGFALGGFAEPTTRHTPIGCRGAEE